MFDVWLNLQNSVQFISRHQAKPYIQFRKGENLKQVNSMTNIGCLPLKTNGLRCSSFKQFPMQKLKAVQQIEKTL